jgi:DNA repair protein RadC
MSLLELYKVAEIELSYKSEVSPSERPLVSNSKDAYHILMAYWDENKIELSEQFKVMMLNRAGRVLGIYEVSSGGTSGTIVDTKLIFTAALKSNASSIILSHNHPAGSLKPSNPDIAVTKKLFEAGKILDINVMDHIILTRENYYSFADNAMLNPL